MEDIEEKQSEQFEKLLSTIEEKMEEFCDNINIVADSVHLFVSVHNKTTGLTHTLNRGKGNYYSRYGQIKQWVKREDRGVSIEDED